MLLVSCSDSCVRKAKGLFMTSQLNTAVSYRVPTRRRQSPLPGARRDKRRTNGRTRRMVSGYLPNPTHTIIDWSLELKLEQELNHRFICSRTVAAALTMHCLLGLRRVVGNTGTESSSSSSGTSSSSCSLGKASLWLLRGERYLTLHNVYVATSAAVQGWCVWSVDRACVVCSRRKGFCDNHGKEPT